MKISTPVRLLASVALLLGAAAVPFRGAQTAPSDSNITVDPRLYQDLRWRSVGPHRGGRVTAVAGVRTQPCTFYMGAVGGGVWKTEDCGIAWRPVTDGQIETGSIGSIAVADSNPSIVYVGTGSAAIRSNVILGRGIYKSTDAGRTWTFAGLKNAGQIGAMAVHPGNPDVAWAAALGSPFGPGDERGVFRTRDGGKTWKRVLFVNAETGARVVALNPSNPDELYAGMYRAFRKWWDIWSGGPATEGGIYKSTDGGDRWQKLSTGLPQKLIGKIDLEVAASSPRVVYAMVEAPGAEGGLYRSDDAGGSWRLVNNSQRLRARPFYFHYVDVNPRNENEVWINELRLHKSTDGGRTFTVVPTPHGDNHGMWFNPDRPAIAVQANDGGANVTLDGGRTWSTILNQPTAELYMVAVDEQFPYRLYGPQQDNSTVIVPSLPPVAWSFDHAAQSWSRGPGCETGQIHPHPSGKVIYGACKGEFGRYDLATGQERHYWVYPQHRYGHDPKDIRYRFPRQSVIHVSPHDPKVLYHASHVLHRTVDEGVTWETISPDLTAFEPDKQVVPGSPITRDVTGEEVYSSIYAMVESRLERGVLWVGANDGPVHVSRDNGKTWKNVTPKDLPPGGRVQNIEDSPHRRGSAYVAVYRTLREHDLEPYIYATSDYGRTWTRLTDGNNGIPADYPTRVVREDTQREGLLYAGTEFGAFVSFDNGRHWQSPQGNLPATPVTDIRVHRQDLVISTMGRSFWILDNITPLQQLAGTHSARTRLFAPRAAYRMRYGGAGTSGPDRPEYPPIGAQIDYLLTGAKPEEVKLEILDAKGTVVRTSTPRTGGGAAASEPDEEMPARRGGGRPRPLPVREGHNRFVWDLRYTGPEGGGDGPLAVPGRYQTRLTVGTWSETQALEVKIDPRVAADGVTQAQLEEQFALQSKLRDAITEARKLADRIRRTREKAQGEAAARLQALHDRIVTPGIVYPRPMLIDQLSNVVRMLGSADQRPGRDAWTRYEDLRKELESIKAEAAPIAR